MNVLTLLGLVLAIGLVVDDAIVVLENIHRRIEEGEDPLLASLHGAREIAFAVIATTAFVLVAVFVPLSFMGGNTGRLFTEFRAGAGGIGDVLGAGRADADADDVFEIAEAASGRHLADPRDGTLLPRHEQWLRWTLDRALRAPILTLAASALLCARRAVVHRAAEGIRADRGSRRGHHPDHRPRRRIVQLHEGKWRCRSNGCCNAMWRMARRWRCSRPSAGSSGRRSAIWRTSSSACRPGRTGPRRQQAIAAEVFPQINAIPGVRGFALNPPSLGARGFQPPVQFVLGGPDYDTLVEWRDRFLEPGAAEPCGC